MCDDTISVPCGVMFGKCWNSNAQRRRRERVAAGAVAVRRDQRAGRAVDLRDGVLDPGTTSARVSLTGFQLMVFE